METTANDRDRSGKGDFKKVANDLNESGRTLKSAGKQEINNLLADVEELISHVGDALDPEITRIRAKVQSGLTDARKALGSSAEQVQRQARDAVNAGGRYVGENPWTALAIAALAGLTVGFLVSRR